MILSRRESDGRPGSRDLPATLFVKSTNVSRKAPQEKQHRQERSRGQNTADGSSSPQRLALVYIAVFAAAIALTVTTVTVLRRPGEVRNDGRPRPPLQAIEGRTAETLLRNLVSVYQSLDSYGDHGFFDLADEKGEQRSAGCMVAFERGRRIRMEILQGYLVVDGNRLRAQTPLYPGQMTDIPAPEKLTLETLFADPHLAVAMGAYQPNEDEAEPENDRSPVFLAPQLLLLLAKDPLKSLLPPDATATLLEPEYLGDDPCDRVRIEHKNDPGDTRASVYGKTLWIDQRDLALRRIDYDLPSGRLARIDLPDTVLNADFSSEGARLAFQMEPADEAQLVERIDPVLSLAPGAPVPGDADLARMRRLETGARSAIRNAIDTDTFTIEWPLGE